MSTEDSEEKKETNEEEPWLPDEIPEEENNKFAREPLWRNPWLRLGLFLIVLAGLSTSNSATRLIVDDLIALIPYSDMLPQRKDENGIDSADDVGKAWGEIVVRTNVSHGVIRVDGRTRGASGGKSIRVTPGRHTVSLRVPGCESWSTSVLIDRDQRRVLQADVCDGTGWITVESAEPGTTLYINGTKVGGDSETRHPVPPGRHTVRATKDGFEPWESTVEVSERKVSMVAARLNAN